MNPIFKAVNVRTDRAHWATATERPNFPGEMIVKALCGSPAHLIGAPDERREDIQVTCKPCLRKGGPDTSYAPPVTDQAEPVEDRCEGVCPADEGTGDCPNGGPGLDDETPPRTDDLYECPEPGDPGHIEVGPDGTVTEVLVAGVDEGPTDWVQRLRDDAPPLLSDLVDTPIFGAMGPLPTFREEIPTLADEPVRDTPAVAGGMGLVLTHRRTRAVIDVVTWSAWHRQHPAWAGTRTWTFAFVKPDGSIGRRRIFPDTTYRAAAATLRLSETPDSTWRLIGGLPTTSLL